MPPAVASPFRLQRVEKAMATVLPRLLVPVFVAVFRDGLQRVVCHVPHLLMRLLLVRLPGISTPELVERPLLPRQMD